MTDTFKTESRGALLEGDRYLALLAIALLGYALMGKGFAYLGFPPLYVGEIAFLIGTIVFLRTGALVASLATLPSLVLVALMVWVLARTIPFVERVRVRLFARQHRRHVWRLCLYRHWSVARGRAQDRYGAPLLQYIAGERSRDIRRVLSHPILGGIHPEVIRSRADRGHHDECGRDASRRNHGFRSDRLSEGLFPLVSGLARHAYHSRRDQSRSYARRPCVRSCSRCSCWDDYACC